MDSLLAGLIDLLFCGLGRVVWRVLRSAGLVQQEFSDGGYATLGFLFFVLTAIGLFMLWDVISFD
ncbi:hypothetical protein [Polaromonas sp. UC242_47]|uniref:hypothetical protein n=1 Tax=Polaromonas sp. UC242_47 TaxID=3374626 RepID=UPI0037B4D40C